MTSPSYNTLNCLTFGNTSDVKKVLILLHGYGSDANDLISVAPYFSNLKSTLFIAPNAPYNVENFFGKQWFSLITKNNSNGSYDIDIASIKEVRESSNILKNLIEEIKTKHNILSNDISLFGFSQGGILSLYTALHSNLQLGSVISHSGIYYGDNEDFVNYNQNILMVHGEDDDVLPLQKYKLSIEYLNNKNIKFESHIEKNLAHSINKSTIEVCEQFLLKNV